MNSESVQAAASTQSRFIIRALDRGKYIDYGVAFAVGACPVLISYYIGAHRTINSHVGYWDSPNWWSLAILLPMLLFVFRFLMARIVPVGPARLPPLRPPIIDLLHDEPARNSVYEALRRCVLSRWNVLVPLAVTLVVHIADAPSYLGPYFGTGAAIPSWATMFEVNAAQIGKLENLLLLLAAGIAQFSAAFLGMLTIVLLFRHNLFFLGNVYQRRWVPPGEEARFFQINPKDVNRCFGFRTANVAFNAQVRALMVAGTAIFLSRYATVVGGAGAQTEARRSFGELSFSDYFPIPSQWLMALSWVVALFVVAMPAVVKLLPRVPGPGGGRAEQSISNYLHEYFSDRTWPKDRNGRDEPHQIVAARFAQNSFWPTGDNRAAMLFFFAYWIFLVTLLPPPLNDLSAVAISLVILAVLAYLLRLGTFAALRLSLRYVDEQLVTSAKELDRALDSVDPRSDRSRDIGVFISYRRRDSAPYARALNERLLEAFRPERIFMDITDIGPGENFVRRIDQALEEVDAVIVLIGEKWLSAADEGSLPRIDDPTDMVHIEVATALRQGKRLFPVLVGSARMPAAQQLPEPLKALAQLNAVELSDTRWDYDVGRLIDAVKG